MNNLPVKCVDMRVFSAAELTGTRARIRLGEKSPAGMMPPHWDTEATCYAWLEKNSLQVRCYNRGVAIEFCGHGLLASAHAAWLEGCLPEKLCSPSATYGTREDGNALWLRCPTLPCTPSPRLPGERWFDCNPLLAAMSGGDTGYWILCWPDGFDLARLKPDLGAISRSTRRAVIVTSAGVEDGNARLRYFAPQYGSDEDTVTGSACVVLADFWRERLGKNLNFIQQSPGGGLVQTRHLGASIEIGGRVEKIEGPENSVNDSRMESP